MEIGVPGAFGHPVQKYAEEESNLETDPATTRHLLLEDSNAMGQAQRTDPATISHVVSETFLYIRLSKKFVSLGLY